MPDRNPLGFDIDDFIPCDECGGDSDVWDGPTQRYLCQVCVDASDTARSIAFGAEEQLRRDRERNEAAWNGLQAATPCARCGNVTLPTRVLDANHGTSWYCATCAQETSPVDP